MEKRLINEIARINHLSGKTLIKEMMSEVPVSAGEKGGDINTEVLRAALIAELDAVNLYVQMANKATNPEVKKVLLDIAKEEKTHIGEFQALLLKLDPQQATELKAGEKEVADL